jgi:hypothetical protein
MKLLLLILVSMIAWGCGPTRHLVDLDDCEDVQTVAGLKIGKCSQVKISK